MGAFKLFWSRVGGGGVMFAFSELERESMMPCYL